MSILRRLLGKLSPVRPVNVEIAVEDPTRGRMRIIKARELSEFPLADGSYGSVIVNGKVVPIQRSLPLKGCFCANCEIGVEYPIEFGGDLYCSQLCAHEAGHSVGVGEHILEAQRQERLSRLPLNSLKNDALDVIRRNWSDTERELKKEELDLDRVFWDDLKSDMWKEHEK